MEYNEGIIIVSHGSAQSEAVKKALEPIEAKIAKAFPKALVLRAFSSERIRGVLRKRGENVLSAKEAVEELMQRGIRQIRVLSLHLIPGAEYEQVLGQMKQLQGMTPDLHLAISRTLLHGELEQQEFIKILPFVIEPYQRNHQEKVQLILLGHGTEHEAGVLYADLEKKIQAAYGNRIWVATLEEGVEAFLQRAQSNDQQAKLILIPLLWIAGNHVRKDFIEKDDSWKNILEKKGYLVEIVEKGLGEYAEIMDLILLFPVTSLSQ